MALILQKLKSFPVKVNIAIPPEAPVIKGFITAHAVPRSKPDMQELQKKVEDGEFEGDDDLLKRAALYDKIEGLTNADGKELTEHDEVMKEVTEGPYSMYLTSALVRAYFDQYQIAPTKNYRPSRGR